MKKGIMDLTVKLRQEVTLMKNAIKLVPCHTEDECSNGHGTRGRALRKRNFAVEEAQLKVGQLEEDLLRIEEEAREDIK